MGASPGECVLKEVARSIAWDAGEGDWHEHTDADDAKGLDVELVKQIKQVDQGRISDYPKRSKGNAEYESDGSIWQVPCDVAMPSATQNELDEDDAKALIDNKVIAVVEGANMPSTPDAIQAFTDATAAR